MERGNARLDNPRLYQGKYEIPAEKVQKAIKTATDKLASKIDIYMDGFPPTGARDYKYPVGPNENWECGMHTGCFLLAYELTGEEKFLNVAKHHMATYRKRVDEKIKLNDHDVGFIFTPSCVAMYRLTGDESARQTALDAVVDYYNDGFSKKGGFIIRGWDPVTKEVNERRCRTMMDTLMNAPLLFWAGEETGKSEYTEAARSQNDLTERLLIREDGSSYHHYQFDVETHAPVGGITFQGNRDESTWARGHAWGVAGFPIAYSYTKDEKYLKVHKDVVYFLLNHLPEDKIAYWDFDFMSGDEPRDSSTNVIAASGMMEAAKYLPDNAPEKEVYLNAAAQLLEAVIDQCTGDIGREYDGLIYRVTGARKIKPYDQYVNQCGVYGDYFYLEALLRYTRPDWKSWW